MRQALKLLTVITLLVLELVGAVAQEPTPRQGTSTTQGIVVEVHLFWTSTCPHCTNARRFLERIIPALPGVRLHSRELDGDDRVEAAFVALSMRFQNDPPGVPLIIIGDEAFVGYRDDATTGA